MNLIDLIIKKDFKRKICFIHVPKCAGTSVNKAIYKQYSHLYRKLRKKYFYHFSAKAATKGAGIVNEDIFEYRRKLLIYFLSKGSYSFVSGHFPYSELAMNHFNDEYDFITVIRNPVDRWFSQYFFNRRKKDSHFKTNLSLEAYADSAEGEALGSLYHDIFYGKSELNKNKIKESCDKVIENINRFKCVGITEYLDVFYRDLYQEFGMKLTVAKKNKNPFTKKEQAKLISDSIRQKVEKICEPDLKVYNYFLDKALSK